MVATLTAFGRIAAFALVGERVLDYLGVSVSALQGAGGLLLRLVALELLTGSARAGPSRRRRNSGPRSPWFRSGPPSWLGPL